MLLLSADFSHTFGCFNSLLLTLLFGCYLYFFCSFCCYSAVRLLLLLLCCSPSAAVIQCAFIRSACLLSVTCIVLINTYRLTQKKFTTPTLTPTNFKNLKLVLSAYRLLFSLLIYKGLHDYLIFVRLFSVERVYHKTVLQYVGDHWIHERPIEFG